MLLYNVFLKHVKNCTTNNYNYSLICVTVFIKLENYTHNETECEILIKDIPGVKLYDYMYVRCHIHTGKQTNKYERVYIYELMGSSY